VQGPSVRTAADPDTSNHARQELREQIVEVSKMKGWWWGVRPYAQASFCWFQNKLLLAAEHVDHACIMPVWITPYTSLPLVS
jgi:hypothetical protein